MPRVMLLIQVKRGPMGRSLNHYPLLMPVPDFQTVMQPLLALLNSTDSKSTAEIRSTLAKTFELSQDEQQELLPSGTQAVWANRVAWALTHLSQAKLVDRPQRAHYRLSERGAQVLAAHPERVDMPVLLDFPEYRAFRERKKAPATVRTQDLDLAEVSPREAIGALVAEAEENLAADLLDAILQQPPEFLETLSLALLQAMGYGGRELLLEHTKKSGDAGLDGIVRQDALGMDLIGVQAKRYDPDNPVQRPAVQAFVGALQGAQTNRGVFITTGRFTSGARAFAKDVSMQLVLIDGLELSRMMVKYGIGTQTKETYEFKELDTDYFES